MPWLELRVETTEQEYQAIEDALFSVGALSVTTIDAKDSPIYEPDPDQPPIWPDPILVGLFDSEVDSSAVQKAFLSFCDIATSDIRWEILEDRVWETEWMEHFKPMCFGDNFWVYAEKVTEPTAEPGATTLLLDPGLAFGTGTHPTTALCLEWVVENDCLNKNIIDYGCGTGLLGIAAMMRGGTYASFVDIDPQALTATKQNLERNQIDADKYDIRLPASFEREPADILLANILSGPLVELAESIARLVKNGGSLCLSGILHSQKQEILNAYQPWFNNLSVKQSGDWLRIAGIRSEVTFQL